MKPSTKPRKTDVLFEEFIWASRQICNDLGLDPKSVQAERYETKGVGLSYTCYGKGKSSPFYFHLKTRTEKSDVATGRMEASLDITYDENSAPFYFHEDVTELQNHDSFLGRWAAWAVFNFNLKHNPVNLESLFNEMDIRVYGIPRYDYPAMTEMHMLIGGMKTYQKNKLLVYRFRHVEHGVKYRSFSYAFLVTHDDIHYFWAFFPDLGGLDSGAANHDLQTTEKLIQSLKIKVERKNFDIKYEDLEKFLEKYAIGFGISLPKNSYLSEILPSEKAFGSEFVDHYSKFLQRYEMKDYAGSLRDLRVLVQHAMEIVCEKKEIDLGDIQQRKIKNICDKMIKSKIIDEIMYNWFLAFTSVANLAAHKDDAIKFFTKQ